tara:strand:- start:4927 stop:5103 length:177 start_codon:yes stop_codon:yes gene_type:complete
MIASNRDRSRGMQPRSQFGDAGDNRMKEMEAELEQLRRKATIQDKLLKKISRNGLMGN